MESRVTMEEMRHARGAIERNTERASKLGFTSLCVVVEGWELWCTATFASDVGLGADTYRVTFPCVHGPSVNQMAAAISALCIVMERGR